MIDDPLLYGELMDLLDYQYKKIDFVDKPMEEKTDKGYFAFIVSGDRGNVDFDEVARILGCNKVKLASAREIEKGK